MPTLGFAHYNLRAPLPLLAQRGMACRVAQVPQTGQVQLFLHDPVGNGVELNLAA